VTDEDDPQRTSLHRSKVIPRYYSITSSAMASTPGGMVMLSALAVLSLITNSNLVGCMTGRLAGLAPLRSPVLRAIKLKPQNKSRVMRCGNGRMIMSQLCTICATFLSAVIFSVVSAWADPPKLPVPAFDQSAVGQRGYFYVRGHGLAERGFALPPGR
jgi:hypothetical protein